MRTIAVIYYPAIHYAVKQLDQTLKQQELIQKHPIKPCNLWLPFDFHLYDEGLSYFPDKDELTNKDIQYLAHHQFAWLADYFEFDAFKNLENIIANRGYIFTKLKNIFPNYSNQQIKWLEQENFHWIHNEQERNHVKQIYNDIRKEWSELLRQDTRTKLEQSQDLMIVSFDSSKTYIDLFDILQNKNCYFIEPITNTYQSGINQLAEQYRYLHRFEPGVNNAYQPYEENIEEKEYVEEPEQTPWITAQSQGNQKKIAHRL